MRIAFIVKGIIRRKRRFYQQLTAIENSGIASVIDVFESDYHRHSIELARNATLEGFNYIIAVGGDGTLNEVVNGILSISKHKSAEELPVVGFLPFGTANDFARSTLLHPKATQFIELLKRNQPKPIDLGLASYLNQEGAEEERWFINVLDAGLGGYVVEKINRSKKRLGPGFTFMRAIVETFLTYDRSPIHLNFDDSTEWYGEILALMIANGHSFGNGLQLAPGAKVNDGVLNIVTLGKVSKMDFVRNILKIKKGKVIQHPELHYQKVQSITATPEMYSCAIDMDGEFVGYAPLTATVVQKRIRFLY